MPSRNNYCNLIGRHVIKKIVNRESKKYIYALYRGKRARSENVMGNVLGYFQKPCLYRDKECWKRFVLKFQYIRFMMNNLSDTMSTEFRSNNFISTKYKTCFGSIYVLVRQVPWLKFGTYTYMYILTISNSTAFYVKKNLLVRQLHC